MEIILQEDIDSLGEIGDIHTCSPLFRHDFPQLAAQAEN